ncbi:MAG TPA: hypothetical protein VJV58_18790 [Bradyrhizobium sp.]|jgi:hypothetical protein|nr:hypothetical protein [Bradyrhizobium sp.]
MSARHQKPQELETPHVDSAPPSYKVQPQKAPDWNTLQAEVTAQFARTIAYLAK